MKIGISIVNYGEQKLLDDCLESINNAPKKPIFFPEIYDCNKNNIGFTNANNEIIKKFLSGIDVPWSDSSPEWIWLLNNDTRVPRETFDVIEDTLNNLSKDVGVIGFKILSMDNPDLIHHAGTGQCFPVGQHKSGSVKLKQFTKRTFEKWVTFASVLIRREVFETIGLLDPNMKMIGSDSDFCFRARAYGWKVIYEPLFIVYHKIGQSQNPKLEIQSQMSNDMLYWQNKWINGKLYFDLDKELL